MKPKYINSWLLLMVCISAAGAACSSSAGSEYVEFHSPANTHEWDPLEELIFKPDTPKDNSPVELCLTVRHSDFFPSTAVRFIVDCSNSERQFSVDTVTLKLADEKGKWLGKGTHGIFTLTLPIRNNFKIGSDCQVSIRPDSPTPITGISAVGLSFRSS